MLLIITTYSPLITHPINHRATLNNTLQSHITGHNTNNAFPNIDNSTVMHQNNPTMKVSVFLYPIKKILKI